jgi:hypothetical protein
MKASKASRRMKAASQARKLRDAAGRFADPPC